jgi:hypothetical protein
MILHDKTSAGRVTINIRYDVYTNTIITQLIEQPGKDSMCAAIQALPIWWVVTVFFRFEYVDLIRP